MPKDYPVSKAATAGAGRKRVIAGAWRTLPELLLA
jgi:hypothetical protein